METFASTKAFERWMAAHHVTDREVWLKLAKKGTPGLGRVEALDVALCWGWIDGQAKPLDDTHWLQRFTPRGPRSRWSKINREKVQALIEAGRMKPPGLAEIERAKADGRWDAAYDSPSKATVPPDLAAALAKNRKAAAAFESLDGANRYAILYRVHVPKKPETRARKIAELVAMLARGETVHPRRRRREPDVRGARRPRA